MVKLKSASAKYQFGKKVSQGKVKAMQKTNYRGTVRKVNKKG